MTTAKCKTCAKKKKIYAFGLCLACYRKLPKNRAYHAACERKRRIEKRDHVNALDRKRQQKPTRKKWRQAYHLKYYAAHKQEILEYQRNYRRADLKKQANYKRRRRARVAGLPDTLTLNKWRAILIKYKNCCVYCGANNVYLEREHKIPASRGGGYTAKNIVPACGHCNRRKRTMTDKEFRKYIKTQPSP